MTVKVSPYYTSLAHYAAAATGSGAHGFVVFNRFYAPDIDLDTLTVQPRLSLSHSDDLRLSLRWIAILRAQLPHAGLAATGGVHRWQDVVKSLLVGAGPRHMPGGLPLIASIRLIAPIRPTCRSIAPSGGAGLRLDSMPEIAHSAFLGFFPRLSWRQRSFPVRPEELGGIVVTSRIMRLLVGPLVAIMGITSLSPQPARAATPPVPDMILPFAEGLTDFTSGPHTWDGNATGSRGSVDFGSPDGAEQHVYAAAGGTATVYNDLGWSRCYVIIDHGNGWQSAYYHLKNVPADLNRKTIKQGELVGDMGAIGVDTCGGGTPGYRHVHFVLLYQWNEYPINGLSMGGYTIHEEPGAYCGSWTRDGDNAVVAESLTLLPPSPTWTEGRCARMEPGLTND